jgi:hypothetical protein
MHWQAVLFWSFGALFVLKLLKMFYNARTRDIYAKNMISLGCDKKKVNRLGDLWRWDLRYYHNALMEEYVERKAYYSANRDKLEPLAKKYDEMMDSRIELHDCLHENKLHWLIFWFKRHI